MKTSKMRESILLPLLCRKLTKYRLTFESQTYWMMKNIWKLYVSDLLAAALVLGLVFIVLITFLSGESPIH